MNTPNRTLGNMLAATSVLHGASLGAQPLQSDPQSTSDQLLSRPHLSPSRALSKEMFMIHGPSFPNSAATALRSQAKEFVENQWQKAYIMLQNNPTLMTSHILIIALRRRAPIQLIRFMLMLNPESVSIPRHGPSPLQVAVQCFCSIDVVKLLLQKCPMALVVTNPGSFLDPLSYAKRFRSTESDIIGLLSLPIEHWSDPNTARSIGTPSPSLIVSLQSGGMGNAAMGRSPVKLSRHPFMKTNPTPPAPTQPSPVQATRSTFDALEMDNLKLICLSVLKGHKRISKEMMAVRSEVDRICESVVKQPKKYLVASDVEKLLQAHRSSLLTSIHDFQKKNARSQLIAMDMKEKAMMLSVVREMESRVDMSVQNSRVDTMASLEAHVEVVSDRLQARLQQLHDRINSEESRPICVNSVVDCSAAGPSTSTTAPQMPDPETTDSDRLHARLQQLHDRINAEELTPIRSQPAVKCTEAASNKTSFQIPKSEETDIRIETIKMKACTMTEGSPSAFTYRSDDTPATTLECDDENHMTVFFPLYDAKGAPGDDDMLALLANDVLVYRPFHHRRVRRARGPGMRGLFCKV